MFSTQGEIERKGQNNRAVLVTEKGIPHVEHTHSWDSAKEFLLVLRKKEKEMFFTHFPFLLRIFRQGHHSRLDQ
jgi:hypothetical protein